MRKDRVQAESASARHPFGTMRVIEEASDQRGRFNTAVERVFLAGSAPDNLPDLLERGIRPVRKFHGISGRLRPRTAEVVTRAEIRPPMRAVDRGPEAL